MNQLLLQIQSLFSQLTNKQKMIFIGAGIVLISAVVSILLWANRTEYALLYSNLDPSAASNVVSDLRSEKIPYKLENGGTTIYVPKERVNDLRLKFVQSGYIKDPVTGYELFEKNNLGMTTFMQHLNFKRALEGELMRTINQFPEVKQSRVHLVIPEDRLFENEKKGSASVVLYLRPGARLSQKQLKGIATLVANSVDGLEAKDVAVMDDEGNVLIEGDEENNLLGEVGNQYELRQSLENSIQKKVMDIVGGVVGRNNAVVKVSAELDFDRIERTQEIVDPDNVVVVSEEKYAESSNNQSDTSSYNIQKTTTNYELSKSKEVYISNTGDIKRLTVAVLVNGRYEKKVDADGNETFEYVPRTQEELDQIAALVKSAVGYNEDRGDVVEIQNLRLEAPIYEKDRDFFATGLQFELWEKIISYLLMIVGMLLAFFLLKGLLKSSVGELALPGGITISGAALPGGAQGEGALESAEKGSGALPEGRKPGELTAEEEREVELLEDMYIKKLSPEARAKMRAADIMTNEVIKYVEENPENAARLIRGWFVNPSGESEE